MRQWVSTNEDLYFNSKGLSLLIPYVQQDVKEVAYNPLNNLKDEKTEAKSTTNDISQFLHGLVTLQKRYW